ncbi:hypothetical protein [Paraburkholderia phenazinium]|uniref:hypothetical protein n=1 Tax=Paraburkholderia phenazinium TaxID=60549 RepID=UPI00158EBD27|nr:hypothetical protein [Paraburkholderia phenazinium]
MTTLLNPDIADVTFARGGYLRLTARIETRTPHLYVAAAASAAASGFAHDCV